MQPGRASAAPKSQSESSPRPTAAASSVPVARASAVCRVVCRLSGEWSGVVHDVTQMEIPKPRMGISQDGITVHPISSAGQKVTHTHTHPLWQGIRIITELHDIIKSWFDWVPGCIKQPLRPTRPRHTTTAVIKSGWELRINHPRWTWLF